MTTVNIPLEYEAEANGVKVKELNMRRSKVRDQRLAKKGSSDEADYEVKLFANLCEVSPELIDDLDSKDYKKLQDEYRGFLS